MSREEGGIAVFGEMIKSLLPISSQLKN